MQVVASHRVWCHVDLDDRSNGCGNLYRGFVHFGMIHSTMVYTGVLRRVAMIVTIECDPISGSKGETKATAKDQTDEERLMEVALEARNNRRTTPAEPMRPCQCQRRARQTMLRFRLEQGLQIAQAAVRQ